MNKILSSILAFLMLTELKGIFGIGDCEWNLQMKYGNSRRREPLFIDYTSRRLIYPIFKNKYSLNNGATFILSCGISGRETDQVVTCNNGQLEIRGHSINLANYGCLESIRMEYFVGSQCSAGSNHRMHHISYQTTSEPQILQYSVCVDSSLNIPLFTRHTILKEWPRAPTSRFLRHNFREFGSPQKDAQYEKNAQAVAFSVAGGADYIRDDRTHYFARGHLVPDGDFPSRYGKKATYWHINVVPQYQTNNNGYWKMIEINTRILAKDCDLDLEVITGAFGDFFTKDQHGNTFHGPMNLNTFDLPIPNFLWKIVVHLPSNTGTAFLIMNNPNGNMGEIENLIGQNNCNNHLQMTQWTKSMIDKINSDPVAIRRQKGNLCITSVPNLISILPEKPDFLNQIQNYL